MKVTNNKELRTDLSLFESILEEISSLSQVPNEVFFSQLSNISLIRVAPTTLLDSLYKIASYDLFDDKIRNFIEKFFEMQLDPNSANSTDKKKQKKILEQRVLDQGFEDFENLKFEIQSSLIKTA